MIIKDVFKISKGKKATESEDSTFPRYIQIEDLRTDDELKYAIPAEKNVMCDENDILIAWDGANAGTIGYNLNGVIGSTLAKLTPTVENIFPIYAGRYLQSKFRYLRDNCTGATIPHISRPVLESLKIPLPPLNQQKKIAAILDAADAYRQKTKALIEKYDQLTQSLFLEMFGDPSSNPMGYQQKSLQELAIQITDGTHHTPTYTETGVPFLRVTDITGSNGSKKFISEEEHSELIKRCHPKKGDILYTKNGTIGVGKIVDWDYDFSIFVSLCLLKPKHDLIEVKYLNHFLNTPFALRQAMKHSKEATIKNLHLVEIKKMKVPYPSIQEQKEFVSKLDLIEEQKAIAQQELKKADELFNSLLQRAFQGELV